MNELQTAINQLRTRANQTTAPTTPGVFFPVLHTFLIALLGKGEFDQILRIIHDKGKASQARLKIFEDAAMAELKTRYAIIKAYADKNNVCNKSARQLLEVFQNRLKTSDKVSRLLFVSLEQALYVLLNDEQANHSYFEQTFGRIKSINADKFIDNKEAFPAFYAWEKESGYFAQHKLASDWYSFNQLMVFAERYDFRHYDTLINELSKDKIDIKQLQEDHQSLFIYAYSDDEKPSPWPTIEEYKSHVMTLMASIEETAISLAPKYAIIFDPSSGEFKMNGKKKDFKQIGCPSNIILATLIPKKGPVKKRVLGYEAAMTRIVKSKLYDRTGPEPDIYEICRSINKSIARLGYPDFLIMPNQTIRINPIYLL